MNARVSAKPFGADSSASEEHGGLVWTPELQAELLDSESWEKALEVYARTMRVAVALVDEQGQLVGPCHNPQPIWKLARDARPEWAATCPFCLDGNGACKAAEDAREAESMVVAHDQGGFAHIASPLWLGDRHLGTLIAGQVFDRYPELLPLERVAKVFGLSAQQLWHLAREQAPVTRTQLKVYGDLLSTLGQAFLKQRYSTILEERLAQASEQYNETLQALNSELSAKVEELDRVKGDLQNLFDASPIATIFLDRTLRISSFTPALATLFRLEASDIGRRITDFAEFFEQIGLVEDLGEILRTLAIGSAQEYRLRSEREGTEATHYLMRVLPYRTNHHVIDGVVITFVDVTLLTESRHI